MWKETSLHRKMLLMKRRCVKYVFTINYWPICICSAIAHCSDFTWFVFGRFYGFQMGKFRYFRSDELLLLIQTQFYFLFVLHIPSIFRRKVDCKILIQQIGTKSSLYSVWLHLHTKITSDWICIQKLLLSSLKGYSCFGH